MAELKYERFKLFEELPDGTEDIHEYVFHEKPATFKMERQRYYKTSKQSLLADLMDALEPISKRQTKTLHLIIETDDMKYPRMITTSFEVTKENYGGR